MIRWQPPGPYEIVFSTRVGGVSEGPYDSLNLGRRSGDDVERVDENRRRVCAEIGADAARLAMNRQIHSALVHRAEPGARGKPGDGLWTEEADLPVLALTADCLPIALARVGGERPGVAVLHVGWRGLLAGIVAEGARALGGRLHAAIGPAIGPCCYEVGPDVAKPLAAAFGADVVRGPQRRPLERGRARAPGRGGRGGRARRPLHPLQSRALLLAPAHRAAARRPGSDGACRLRASAPPTSGSGPRSGPT